MENKYRVDHVDSSLPRWLIEVAFLCLIAQSVINWSPLLIWMEENASWLQAIVQTVGPVVMYVGLLRGMRSLYHPFRIWWRVMIVLNLLGFISLTFPGLLIEFNLTLAVSLMFIYVPFGCLLALSYQGRLRQVGIWMALYMLISAIIPTLCYLLIENMEGFNTLWLEVPTVGANLIYACVLRRVLV